MYRFSAHRAPPVLPVILFALGLGSTIPSDPVAAAGDLRGLVDGPQRRTDNKARDIYRHPAEVLAFLGVRNDATVVEIWPGSGYWTEILAPYLRDQGRYIAAGFENDGASPERQRAVKSFAAKLAADPADYGKVVVTEFSGLRHDIAPPGSADFVLTFRAVHDFLESNDPDEADHAFQAFYKALKPGGILGIEDHRASPTAPQDPRAKSGYVREDYVIALAGKAGFRLTGRSDINANPKDTKDYQAGVWTLPPSFRLKEVDHAKYAAIGESDRFLLRFEKPRP